jgi:hypothetical protein
VKRDLDIRCPARAWPILLMRLRDAVPSISFRTLDPRKDSPAVSTYPPHPLYRFHPALTERWASRPCPGVFFRSFSLLCFSSHVKPRVRGPDPKGDCGWKAIRCLPRSTLSLIPGKFPVCPHGQPVRVQNDSFVETPDNRRGARSWISRKGRRRT